MSDTPLKSKFSEIGDVDTAMTLFKGASGISVLLAADLSDEETEVAFLSDTTGAPVNGMLVIGDELIFYSGMLGRDRVFDLARGAGGSLAAAHTAGTPVEIHPRFYIPQAWQDAMIALQEKCNDLQAQLDALA